MSKLFLAPILLLTLVISGCGVNKISLDSVKKNIENAPLVQNSSWCSEFKDKNKLWVSTENFNGSNHAPAVQHVCRGERELFYLQMNWNDKASLHTGSLVSVSGVSSFPIFSEYADPAVSLVENKNPDQVSVSIDRKVIIYDEVTNEFKSEADHDLESSGQSLEYTIYNILNVENKNQQFYVTLASTTWFSGDKAVEVALKETGCPVERIRNGDCAGSLNNGFYISKNFGPKLILPLVSNAEIFIYEKSKLTKVTPDYFFNLFKKNAFTVEESHTPFIIEIKNNKIQKIETQYTP